MTNCPNCGAPITGWQCEYCETVFDISKENNLLQAKTKYLHDITATQELYEAAILAMRNYVITPNETRKLFGLKEIKDERRRYIEQELRGPYGIK